MDQNSPVGTKSDKSNLIVGALILFIGIVIGGVFGGGVLSNVENANLQGQVIESEEVTRVDTGKAQWSDAQIEALKNIKEVRIVTGTEEDLKTAYNIDVKAQQNTSPDNNEEKIAELKSLGIFGSSGIPNNPNPNGPILVCFEPGFGFYSPVTNWWDNWGDWCILASS